MLPLSMVLLRWNAVDCAVNPVAVVIGPKAKKLSFEIKLVPEQYLVQQLLPNRSDHAFNEGMGKPGRTEPT